MLPQANIDLNLLDDTVAKFIKELNKLHYQINAVFPLQSVWMIKDENYLEESNCVIFEFYRKSKDNLQQYIDTERNKYKIELYQLQNQVHRWIEQRSCTSQEIATMEANIRSTEKRIEDLQLNGIVLLSQNIDGHHLTISSQIKRDNTLLPLSTPSHVIEEDNVFYCIASNERRIIVGAVNKLQLFDNQLNVQREIKWNHERLNDICWCPALDRFLLITPKDIFTLKDTTMDVELCINICKNSRTDCWYCATCYDNMIFLSTWGFSSSVFKYNIQPAIECISSYRPPSSCKENEFIQNLACNHIALAMTIVDAQNQIYFHLCSLTTLKHLRTIQLGIVSFGFRTQCCSLSNGEWLIVNPNDSTILQISTEQGRISEETRGSTLWDAIQLDNNAIVALSDKKITLHKLC